MISNFTEYFAGFTTGAIALRLLFAAVLGCIIGLERATKHHPAGMRTFALVCLGAAASAIVNIYLGTAFGAGRTDLSRIPAGVVSGIGFLGVGTIIITGKNQVRGLTTAAGLWTTATLGIMWAPGCSRSVSYCSYLSSARCSALHGSAVYRRNTTVTSDCIWRSIRP